MEGGREGGREGEREVSRKETREPKQPQRDTASAGKSLPEGSSPIRPLSCAPTGLKYRRITTFQLLPNGLGRSEGGGEGRG
jgi:hypothetical protein